MAFESTVTKFAARTSTGVQTIDTGLGVAVQGLMFFYGTIGTTENVAQDDIRRGVGIADGAMNQASNGYCWPWHADQRHGSGDFLVAGRVIKQVGVLSGGNFDTTVIAEAALTAVNGDGTIEITWSTVTGVAFPITVFAYTGVANSAFGTFTALNAAPAATVALGWRPSFVTMIWGRATIASFIWESGMGFVTDTPHEGGATTDQDYGTSWYAWKSFDGGGTLRGTQTWGRVTNGTQLLNDWQPGDTSLPFSNYDEWRVDLTATGFNVVKTRFIEAQVLPVAYLALDTVVAELFANATPTYHNPAWGAGERQYLCRVAANSALTTSVDTPIGAETDAFIVQSMQGAIDRHGVQSGVWSGLHRNRDASAPQSLLPSEAATASFNNRESARIRPRIDGGAGITKVYSRAIEVTRQNVLDPNIVDVIGETFNASDVSTDVSAMHTHPVIFLGQLAMPIVTTLDPIVHCPAGGDVLYVELWADVNPNQLVTTVVWDWGPTIAYGNTSVPAVMSYNMGVSNSHRATIPWPLVIHVGSDDNFIPYPVAMSPIIFEDEVQEFPWTSGTWHVRATVTNYNGTVIGNDVAFQIQCGQGQIYRRL